MVGKAEAVGDPAYLRLKMGELTKQLRILQADNMKIKKELEDSKRCIKELENRQIKVNNNKQKSENYKSMVVTKWIDDPINVADMMTELAEVMKEDARDITRRVFLEHGITPYSDLEDEVFRPPLMGVSKPISEVSKEIEIFNENARREIELSSQIDELIKERQIVRKGLTAPTSENTSDIDSQTMAPGFPQKKPRKGPATLSDVQFAKPRLDVISSVVSTENVFVGRDVHLGEVRVDEQTDNDTAVGGEVWRSSDKTTKRARRKIKRRDANNTCKSSDNLPQVDAVMMSRPPGMVNRPGRVVRGPRSVSRGSGANKTVVSDAVAYVKNLDTPSVRTVGIIKRRPPRSAVVCIRREEAGLSYAEILRKARENVNLDEIGINNTRIRWAANGNILIEISGTEMNSKADLLADRLKPILGDDATISRPVAKGELRIWGFDDSVCSGEVACVVSDLGGCLPSEVSVGKFIRMINGLGSVWVKCPLASAIKIAATDRIRIGWTFARIELQENKPMQCFKCWRFGHMRNTCKSDIDRSSSCFRCGKSGHSVRQCSVKPNCVICEQDGRAANHRIGSANCGALDEGRRRKPSQILQDRRPGIASGNG